MKKLLQILAFALFGTTLANAALAESCWKVVGWSAPDTMGVEAFVEHAECAITPQGYAWGNVMGAPTPMWLLISLDDTRVGTNNNFNASLWYSHEDAEGKPVVETSSHGTVLSHNPPRQGTPVVGAKVRLRHRQTGNCIDTVPVNGARATNRTCSGDPSLLFDLRDAGDDNFYLKNTADSQCLFTQTWNGAPAMHWWCGQGEGFKFNLEATFDGGYRLKGIANHQCLFGNYAQGGEIHSWGCWNDPNMVYFVDLVELPFEQTGMWPFDAPAGTTLFDQAGTNDGAIIRGAIRNDGIIGGGLDFDGVDDYAQIPDHADLDIGTGDFSVLFWVKTTQDSGVKVLLDKRAYFPYRGWQVYLYKGHVGIQLSDGVGSGYTNYNSSVDVADGTWHHVAITVDRNDTEGLRFYLDGDLMDKRNPTGRQGSLANNVPLRLAVHPSYFGAWWYWQGSLDQLEVYSGAVDSAAIEDLADPARICRP